MAEEESKPPLKKQMSKFGEPSWSGTKRRIFEKLGTFDDKKMQRVSTEFRHVTGVVSEAEEHEYHSKDSSSQVRKKSKKFSEDHTFNSMAISHKANVTPDLTDSSYPEQILILTDNSDVEDSMRSSAQNAPIPKPEKQRKSRFAPSNPMFKMDKVTRKIVAVSKNAGALY